MIKFIQKLFGIDTESDYDKRIRIAQEKNREDRYKSYGYWTTELVEWLITCEDKAVLFNCMQLLRNNLWPEQIPSMPDNYNEIVKDETHELRGAMRFFNTEIVTIIQEKIFTPSMSDKYYTADYNYWVKNNESLINDGKKEQ